MKKNSETKSPVVYNGRTWSHRIRVFKDGQTKYGRREGFETQQEAINSYKKYEVEYQQAIVAQQKLMLRRENISFQDYLQTWYMSFYEPRVRQSTRSVSEYMLKQIIIPAIDLDVPLRSVTVEYLDALLARVAMHSKSTGNSVRGLLGIAFKDAISNGYLTKNPMPDTRMYPRPKPRVRVFGVEELKVFVQVASDSDWYLEILFALFCGLRKGEILGLKFSDVDMECATIHVQRQAGYHEGEKPLKTENSNRILHIHEVVVREIKKRREMLEDRISNEKGDYKKLEYISCQKNGMLHSPAAMNIALAKLCKRNGLPVISVHGLRHQYATILLEQGVSIERISALLGHASISTTYEYYLDVMGAEEEILSFMNENFSAGG